MTDSDDTRPFAYLNYIVFDEDMYRVTSGFKRVSEDAGFDAGQEVISMNPGIGFERLSFGAPLEITEEGFVYIWVSNESENTKVWFDDLTLNRCQRELRTARWWSSLARLISRCGVTVKIILLRSTIF